VFGCEGEEVAIGVVAVAFKEDEVSTDSLVDWVWVICRLDLP